MKLGDRNSEVTEVQQFLIGAGFLTPIYKGDMPVSPESHYGVLTKKAVIDLQKVLGLEPTGIWDNSIYAIVASRYDIVASRYDIDASRDDISPIDALGYKPKRDNKTATKKVIQAPTFNTETCPKGRWFDQNKEIECYVLNRLTGTKIIFGISPDEVSESNSAQFDDADVRGRSSPFKQYSQSGPRSVSFTVTLYADYCPMGIVQTVSAVKALVYPKYTDVIEAPHAYFKIGKFMALDGVVNSVSVSWRKPFRDGYYLFADVSIDMDEVRSVAQSAEEVENNG